MSKIVKVTRIEFKKKLRGKIEIKFNCPKCQAPLVCEREEIGTSDKCPHCAQRFIVSGEIENRLQAEEDEKEHARVAKIKAQADAKLAQNEQEQRDRLSEEQNRLNANRNHAEQIREKKKRDIVAQQKKIEQQINSPVTIESYPLLEIYYRLLRILGVCCAILAGIIFLAGIAPLEKSSNWMMTAWFLICAFFGGWLWFWIWLAAECLRAFINVTIDTRMIRIQTKPKAQE